MSRTSNFHVSNLKLQVPIQMQIPQFLFSGKWCLLGRNWHTVAYAYRLNFDRLFRSHRLNLARKATRIFQTMAKYAREKKKERERERKVEARMRLPPYFAYNWIYINFHGKLTCEDFDCRGHSFKTNRSRLDGNMARLIELFAGNCDA